MLARRYLTQTGIAALTLAFLATLAVQQTKIESVTTPASAASGGPETKPAPRIHLKDGVLRFPGGKAIQIAKLPVTTSVVASPKKRDRRTAAVSRDGQLAAVLDLQTKTVTVLDGAARELRKISISRRFAQVHVSDSGMVVVTGYVRSHPMQTPTHQDVAVYDSKGKQIKLFSRVQPGTVNVIFLGGGSAAAIILPSVSLEIVWEDGEAAHRKLKPLSHAGKEDFSIGAVATDPQGRRVVIATLVIGDIGDPERTNVLVYHAAAERRFNWSWTKWIQEGSYFPPGTMAVSPDATQCYTIEKRLVRCFDLVKNRQEWVRIVGNRDLGTTKPQVASALYVGQQRVVTAHLVPTGPGWRVLYSVFDRKGKPCTAYPAKSVRSALNSIVSEEIKEMPRLLWTVSEDGRSLQTLVKPQIRIPLVSEP